MLAHIARIRSCTACRAVGLERRNATAWHEQLRDERVIDREERYGFSDTEAHVRARKRAGLNARPDLFRI